MVRREMTYDYPRAYWEGGDPKKGDSGYRDLGYQNFPAQYVVLHKILQRKPESVLDIGGARGYITKMLEWNGVSGQCTDISEYCEATRVTKNFTRVNITEMRLPFADKQFDLAFSIAVFEHLPEKSLEHVIKEVARVCKRGLICPSLNNIPNDGDKTHETLKPREWWEKQFKFWAPSFPVEIVDKEDMEKGAPVFPVPKSGAKLVLNVGSYIVMFHSNQDILVTNMDNIQGLEQFAHSWGYHYATYTAPQPMVFASNSVDAINCSHMLEHLSREDGLKFLQECHRVLKPDGIMRIAVPSAVRLCREFADRDSLIKKYGIFNVGAEKAEDDADALYRLLLDNHKTIYDYLALNKLLGRAGFKMIANSEFDGTQSTELRKTIYDMYPEISLYVEGMKIESKTVEQVAKEGLQAENATREELTKKYTDDFAGEATTVGNPQPAAPAATTAASLPQLKAVKNVAIVSTPFFGLPPKSYSGLEKIVYDLAVSLGKKGLDVTVFAPKGSKVEGCMVVETVEPANNTNVNWRELEKQCSDIYKQQLIDGKFDIIHDNTWWLWPYMLKQEHPELRICHTHHGHLNFTSLPPGVEHMNLCAISQYMKREYEQYGFKDVSYVYNGVDIDKYSFKKEKQNKLVFVGRLDMVKRPDLAIEIAKKANTPIDIIGGTFVNDLNYVETIRQQIIANKPLTSGNFNAPHEYKIKAMQEAKAIIIPSQFQEPFGLIAAEAMACGTPAIALDDGALREVIADGETGFVCKTVEEMVNAVKQVDRLKPEDCRRRAEMLFSRDRMAESYIEFYKQCL